MATPAELLADVEKAITAVLNGAQSYTLIGSRTVNRGDLEILDKMQTKFLLQVGAADGSRPRVASADMSNP